MSNSQANDPMSGFLFTAPNEDSGPNYASNDQQSVRIGDEIDAFFKVGIHY